MYVPVINETLSDTAEKGIIESNEACEVAKICLRFIGENRQVIEFPGEYFVTYAESLRKVLALYAEPAAIEWFRDKSIIPSEYWLLPERLGVAARIINEIEAASSLLPPEKEVQQFGWYQKRKEWFLSSLERIKSLFWDPAWALEENRKHIMVGRVKCPASAQ